MNLFKISFTVIALAAAPGFAGGPTVITDDPATAPTPAAVHDWSGAYIGLSYGTASGDAEFGGPDNSFSFADGSVAGGHAGYLVQRGSFVYGGELAYGTVSDMYFTGFNPDEGIDYLVDLKARGGYAANRALFYGVLGYSMSNLQADGAEADVDGASFGVGAEFAISKRLIVGIEYLSRDISGVPDMSTVVGKASVDTLSLRVGLSF